MEADDVESEVQHLVVGTFHTNLYHSLRNDWPTTPIALTRSNSTTHAPPSSLVPSHKPAMANRRYIHSVVPAV
jgi:hypothetical protein